MYCFNGVISQISGQMALWLCFMADTEIFSHRLLLSSLRSELRHRSGVMEFTPISVNFSVSHSMRSRCFVGATPMAILFGQNGGMLIESRISTVARLGCASLRRHVNRRPLPSITSIISPGDFRKTFTQCCESLSGNVWVVAISGA